MTSFILRFGLGLLLVSAPFPAQATGEAGGEPAAEQLAPPASPAPAVAVVPPLTGKPWRLAELVSEPLAAEQTAPYLLFTVDGDLLGFGGCNYFVGRYRLDDDGKLLVSSLRATHKQCPEAPAPETTLLASLVLANGLEVGTTELIFSVDGSPLMKLGEAPDISTEELTQQGKLLKAKKTRKHKARGKKKKGAGKAKKHTKKPAAKKAGKKPRAAARPAVKK